MWKKLENVHPGDVVSLDPSAELWLMVSVSPISASFLAKFTYLRFGSATYQSATWLVWRAVYVHMQKEST